VRVTACEVGSRREVQTQQSTIAEQQAKIAALQTLLAGASSSSLRVARIVCGRFWLMNSISLSAPAID
jgi:hypothetical protein